jgi:hypothetical protein
MSHILPAGLTRLFRPRGRHRAARNAARAYHPSARPLAVAHNLPTPAPHLTAAEELLFGGSYDELVTDPGFGDALLRFRAAFGGAR